MIDEFIEFCRAKGDEAYDYCRTDKCAVAQFLIASGRAAQPNCGPYQYTDSSGEFVDYPNEMDDLALNAEPRTFAGIVALYEEQK